MDWIFLLNLIVITFSAVAVLAVGELWLVAVDFELWLVVGCGCLVAVLVVGEWLLVAVELLDLNLVDDC